MPPRLSARPARENDFSNVGKVGRRTGVTLPQGRLDVNGMEEISGIFSSPRKPSPLRKSMSVMESVEERVDNGVTPKQTRSARKSLPPPRSASPRKSGISGTAKRGKVVDVLGHENVQSRTSDQSAEENESAPTPTLLATGARRFSPEKTPLKDVTKSRQQSVRSARQVPTDKSVEESIHDSIEMPGDLTEDLEISTQIPLVETDLVIDDFVAPPVDDEDRISIAASLEDDFEEPLLPPPFDDEEADQTFKPESRAKSNPKEPTVANSRRKRKSDALEQEVEADTISSPAAKRAKRISEQNSGGNKKEKSPKATVAQIPTPRPRGRPPLKKKDPNSKISTQREDELNKIVEKVRARPGQKKSLYVLRRETPTEDGATHTRSGRVSVKPLAYWRNERCVFGGSPGGASLQDGARFPLNSIKEIIRTEEVLAKDAKKGKGGKKGKAKAVLQKRSVPVDGAEDQDQEESETEEVGEDEELDDSDAEPWEKERGIFRGPMAVWNQHQQSPTDGEEEMDIAYAPASIELREVKDSTFRYAKMLSMKFFGSGIVDLPPGSNKKSKNSRRMHMSFFVATGRVTVQVGPLGGPESKFSIGKGGWWQVPRGNQYSIANDLHRPAKVFFSQACEPVPQDSDD